MTDETMTNDNIPTSDHLDLDLETEETTHTATDVEVTQTPSSLFRRALLGGYKTPDVDQYVEKSKEVLDAVIEENRDLKVRIDEMREGSITMRTALSSALKFSENISDSAVREARSILEHAKTQAERYANETAHANGTLAHEIESLRAHRDRLTAELNQTVDSHIRLLDAIETNTLSESSRQKAHDLLELGNLG